MDDLVLPPKLLSHLSKAAEIVRSHDFIQVYSHYDADGISAASIIAKTLMREGKEFRVTLFTTLNDPNMKIIKDTPSECIMISDLGASYIKQLDELSCDVVALDHHTVEQQAERVCYANPHLYGIDGMTSGCGATMAFLFSITMNEKNWDLVQIAFAGIAGDRQHINGLKGLNEHLLKTGKKKGFIHVTEGSLVPPGNLGSELLLSTDPYIVGVSGNSEGVSKLLSDAKIDKGKDYMDLTVDERRKLSSIIALKLVEQGTTLQTMNELARTRYYLPDWKIDAETFASLLNGCGRLGLGGVGISAALGDIPSMEEANDLNDTSKKQIMNGVLELTPSTITGMKNIQWFDSSTLGFTGIICGIAMQFIGDPSKPVFGINRSEELAKVSGRGTWAQLEKGVDLSIALKRACESVGGNGGGHKIASGGSFPSLRMDEFLNNLNNIIGEQLRSSK